MAGHYSANNDRNEPPYDYTNEPTVARRDIASMTPLERFEYAKTYRIGFGVFKGMELTQIAAVGAGEDERGLLYIEWLSRQDWLNVACRGAIDAFVAWPPVARDMSLAVKEQFAKKGPKAN
jgi:hypothetical protein